MKAIQEWLGHSNISTTLNIYTHLDYQNKVSSANAIIGILSGTKKRTRNSRKLSIEFLSKTHTAGGRT